MNYSQVTYAYFWEWVFSKLKTTEEAKISPFNISECLTMPHFTKTQHRALFRAYEQDHSITLGENGNVVEDIWSLCLGHPGLTCRCGLELGFALSKKEDKTV